MDGTADGVRLRRARILLRIQELRERRCRIEVARVEATLSHAMALATAARLACDAHAIAGGERIRAAHKALQGQLIDQAALSGVTELEREVAARATALGRNANDARTGVLGWQQRLEAARSAFRAEARKQQRKQVIADMAAASFYRAVDRADEAELEIQTTDRWHAA